MKLNSCTTLVDEEKFIKHNILVYRNKRLGKNIREISLKRLEDYAFLKRTTTEQIFENYDKQKDSQAN